MSDTTTTTLIEILEEERDCLSKDIYGLFQIVDCVTKALQAAEGDADWVDELVGEIHLIRYQLQGALGQFVTAYEEEDRISPPPSR